MDIKRYDLVYSEFFEGGGIGEKENGKYCEYKDYEKLQSDNAELVDKYKNAIDNYKRLKVINKNFAHYHLIADARIEILEGVISALTKHNPSKE